MRGRKMTELNKRTIVDYYLARGPARISKKARKEAEARLRKTCRWLHLITLYRRGLLTHAKDGHLCFTPEGISVARMLIRDTGRRIRSKGRGKGLGRGRGRGPIGRPTRAVGGRRQPNPTSLAKTLIGKVAEPGSRFSLTALKAGLKKAGYRNVKGWFNEMIRDALRRRVITPVSQSVYVFTPEAATNPCPWRLVKTRRRKGK